MQKSAENIGKRLLSALDRKGYTQAELARKAKCTPAGISNIVGGHSSGRELIQKISKVLEISPYWLATGEGEAPEWEQKKEIPTIELKTAHEYPVLGHAGAADGGQRGILAEHPEVKQLPKNLALIAVRGSSASPVIYDNQFALVNLIRKVNPNNVVVVVLMDSDAVIVKRWCPQSDGEHVVLASLDGGRDSLVVKYNNIRHVWPVVGVLYE